MWGVSKCLPTKYKLIKRENQKPSIGEPGKHYLSWSELNGCRRPPAQPAGKMQNLNPPMKAESRGPTEPLAHTPQIHQTYEKQRQTRALLRPWRPEEVTWKLCKRTQLSPPLTNSPAPIPAPNRELCWASVQVSASSWVPSFREHTLRSWDIKGHAIYNLLSKGSEKNEGHVCACGEWENKCGKRVSLMDSWWKA